MLMNHFLLPYKYKWPGAILVLAGLAGLVFYLWFDFRLIVPVFAVYSSFFVTKTFTVIQTNITDELILLSLLAGFFLLVFSKEKTESEELDKIRARAFSKAVLANMVLLFLSVLLIFGNGFLAIALLNLFSTFIFYLVFFYFLKRKDYPSR
jgi:hypothetical protein